ncbi:UNVERIFIED_CONTAM: hypothetical protein K2H54_020968 [Gekko kuhli]
MTSPHGTKDIELTCSPSFGSVYHLLILEAELDVTSQDLSSQAEFPIAIPPASRTKGATRHDPTTHSQCDNHCCRSPPIPTHLISIISTSPRITHCVFYGGIWAQSKLLPIQPEFQQVPCSKKAHTS